MRATLWHAFERAPWDTGCCSSLLVVRGGDSPKAVTEEPFLWDSVGCVEPIVHEESVGVNGALERVDARASGG
jgi:hypothetical protein